SRAISQACASNHGSWCGPTMARIAEKMKARPRSGDKSKCNSIASGHPFQRPDDTHLGGLAMGRHLSAALDIGSVRLVVGVGAQHHVPIGKRRPPAELGLDARRIEDKIGRDHAVVVWAEWRDAQEVRGL